MALNTTDTKLSDLRLWLVLSSVSSSHCFLRSAYVGTSAFYFRFETSLVGRCDTCFPVASFILMKLHLPFSLFFSTKGFFLKG